MSASVSPGYVLLLGTGSRRPALCPIDTAHFGLMQFAATFKHRPLTISDTLDRSLVGCFFQFRFCALKKWYNGAGRTHRNRAIVHKQLAGFTQNMVQPVYSSP